MFIGCVLLAVATGSTANGWVIMYAIAQLVFGFGVGGMNTLAWWLMFLTPGYRLGVVAWLQTVLGMWCIRLFAYMLDTLDSHCDRSSCMRCRLGAIDCSLEMNMRGVAFPTCKCVRSCISCKPCVNLLWLSSLFSTNSNHNNDDNNAFQLMTS